MFIVHLFVSYARGNLCHLFSSAWSLCLSCICLSAMHAIICVTCSLPPGVRGWLRLLLVSLPGLFCLSFWFDVK